MTLVCVCVNVLYCCALRCVFGGGFRGAALLRRPPVIYLDKPIVAGD